MITSLRRLFVGLTLAVVAAASAAAFEGKVNMKMTSGKDTMPMTYYIKDTKMRVEFAVPADKKGSSGTTMASVFDMKAMEMMVLMPEEKMYMVMKIPDVSEMQKGKKNKKDTEFAPTGRKETIAGYEAEEYVGVSEGRRTELWVTKGMGKFMMANQGKGGFGGGKQQTSAWENFMREGDFFALRVIQRKKENGPEEMRMEVTNIDKVPQSDALFRAPKDFQKFQMPSMGDMMKGMIPGGAGER